MSLPDRSRRHFLQQIARGSLGLAALPALRPLAAEAGALPRPDPGAVADEAYWERVRSEFLIRPGLVPMNAANLCPAPRSVVRAAAAATEDVDADVSFQNRAKYAAAQERIRERIAAYAGASAEEIAIVRNASEANNIVAGGLELGSEAEVVLLDQNHATNLVAWQVRAARYGFGVRLVSLDPTPASPGQVLDAFLAALTPRTRVLAFSDVSNVTGVRLPARELCRAARERGIYTHVDGAQTLGVLRRDLRDLGCDSYAASAHKWLMGPRETGILFAREERLPELWPGVVGVGWGTTATPTARGARKLETLGQRNDATVSALDATLELHERIGPARIEARVEELAAALWEGLAGVRGARMVTARDPALRAGVVVARFDPLDHRAIFESLYRDHGIAGAATGGLRLCPHVYNTMGDVERAVRAVDAVVRGMA
jgi:isopenicillin-N epimerase